MQERQEEQRDELRGQAYRSGGPELGPRSSAETPLGSCSQASIVRARCRWTRGASILRARCRWTRGAGRDQAPRARSAPVAPPRPPVAAPCQAPASPSIRWGYRAPAHTAGRHGQLCTCLPGRAGCCRDSTAFRAERRGFSPGSACISTWFSGAGFRVSGTASMTPAPCDGVRFVEVKPKRNPARCQT